MSGAMKKKRYNMILDQEVVEKLQAWLKPRGITFSGYINSLIVENVNALDILQNVTDLKDVSLGQLTQLYASMARELEEEKKKKKGVKNK